ncbi:MAG: tRNA (guanine-N1)-methyltransferase [Cyanobacteria bacterium P01_F01_bin.53]
MESPSPQASQTPANHHRQPKQKQPENRQPDWQQEGAAHFHVGDAFFRTSSQTGRNLAILAAIAHKQRTGNLRIIDAMTGCGVRPLRYVLEADADYVWANEGNGDLHHTLTTNLSQSLPPERYRITHQDANALFFDCHQRQDFYDLIDIDSFGSPMPTLSTSLWAIKLGGLLYLTSTDGRATSGHAPNKSLQTYGAYARSHPAAHEQGLRLLVGNAVQQAAARGLSAQPVFSFYKGEVNRVMMRITRQPSWDTAHYGFLAYCHSCGQFQTIPWKKLGRVSCPCAAEESPVLSGPLWLGPLHNRNELQAMIAIARRKQESQKQESQKQDSQWQTCHKLLDLMQTEIDLPPYHYPLAEIGRRGKMDIPPRQQLIQKLCQQGFTATATHISSQAIKTNAPIATCIQLAKTAN